MKKVFLSLILLVALFSFSTRAMAEGSSIFEGIRTAYPFKGYPQTDGAGYLLPGILPGDEFVHADPESGVWAYLSRDLRIEIYRCAADLETGPAVWYEAEIWSRGPIFRVFNDDPARPRYGHDFPYLIAREHRVVLALNGDFYTFRIGSEIPLGVIIRDGKIISAKTNPGKVNELPPLDELSLYPDGRMEVRYPGEMKASEYLERGALDVLAFGPILIRAWKIDDRVQNKSQDLQPRSAIGMIDTGHYIAINAEGRTKRSAGVSYLFLAERMQKRGALKAFNLDGGQSSGMFFMGTAINEPAEFNNSKFIRKQPDIIGIGFSEQVRTDRDK